MSFRAFIAVDLAPLPALEPFLKDLMGVRGLKPVDAANLHVTLKFLGDVEETKVKGLEAAIRASSEGVAPFEVEVVGSGVFPPRGSARVVWAGLMGAEPLASISARLEKALEPLGFAPEGRGFKPHLTLARVKDPLASSTVRSIATSYETTKFGAKGVAEVLLKRSVLRPQGPEYSTVVSVPLIG
ncbi:MAG: RNA 2',3'-cyclic phosphodiesterase [Methanomassiliicoccales archaeon]|jgi:2'-5' RNA ligase|nr:RNA 2',3'-cyclic phosphodiesterase [Methanomassiliicoccales archaeon]